MRTSSARHLRLANRVGLGLGLLGVAGLGACVDKPAPQKIERLSPFDRGGTPIKSSDPNDPLRNPATEAPRGRDGDQLPEAEVDAVIAEAAAAAATGNVAQQRSILRRCANKTPVSARCDGEMGLSMIGAKNRRVAALYYLVAAAGVDDPRADAQLYLHVGEALRSQGKLDEAVVALTMAHAREPSPEITFALGQALSLTPDRLVEAADRIAEARAQDDRLTWLHDEAVIRGQIPASEQAALAVALLRQYIERATGLPATEVPTPPASLEPRIKELEMLVKQYPTQAEWEKTRAEGGAAPETGAGEAAPEPGEAAPEPGEAAPAPSDGEAAPEPGQPS